MCPANAAQLYDMRRMLLVDLGDNTGDNPSSPDARRLSEFKVPFVRREPRVIAEPNSATESSNPNVEDEGGGRTAALLLLYFCFNTAVLLHYCCITTDASESAQPSEESTDASESAQPSEEVRLRRYLSAVKAL